MPFHHAHRRDDAQMQHAFAPGTHKKPVKIGHKMLLQKFNSPSEMLPGRHLSAASAPRCLNNLNETLFQRSLSCPTSALHICPVGEGMERGKGKQVMLGFSLFFFLVPSKTNITVIPTPVVRLM